MTSHMVAVLFALPIALLAAESPPPGENVALHKRYTLLPSPNYSYCTDPSDATQLTDGLRARGYFWTQKETVGWVGIASRFIAIDLGQVYPIKGVSFSTAAGVAQVEWPAELLVFVSDDGKRWFEAGDLVALSARKGEPPKGKYANHTFWTDELNTHGRFVQVAAKPTSMFVFVDEIEVFRGDDALLAKAHSGPSAESVAALVAARNFNGIIKAQLRRDLDAARQGLAAHKLDAEAKASLSQKAQDLGQKIETMPNVAPEGFRAVLPMTDLEREIFRFQAEVWRAQGKPPLRAWKTHRWDPLAPSQEPPDKAPRAAIEVHMMNNEYRADVLNLTNADSADKQLCLRIDGLPGGTNPDYIAVHEVLCVGTRHFVAVSAALPPARRDGDSYVLSVPSGMTRQVWLSFNPRSLKPGTHKGKVAVRDGNRRKLSVPIRLQVHPLRFPDSTTLLVGGCEYTNMDRMYGVTPQNRDLLIAHLKEHCVNAPWATATAMPPGEYDAAGNLTQKPDTRNFDEWVPRWRGAKAYFVFNAVGDSFAGAKMGTEHCEKRVGQWIRFWAQHVRDLGLKPSQLHLLLLDEPGTKEQYDIITAWAKAIKKAEPEVVLWMDPQPTEDKTCLEMFASVDVLCPLRSMWLDHGEWFPKLFLEQQKQGRVLWLYSANGPARNFDPFAYYLLQEWHCFQIGARGSVFWAFGDTGGGSVWNEYAATESGPYCPFYLEDAALTPAKYMEAVREGAEDYEYLVMLRDRIAALEKAGKAGSRLERAKALLRGAADRVMAQQKGVNYRWDEEKDRTVADTVRIEVLEMLAALR